MENTSAWRATGSSSELLGRHVARLALDDAGVGDLDARRRLRDAEVDEPRDAVGAHEDVLRRDVAMDDAERRAVLVARLVRRVEAEEHRLGDRGGDLRRASALRVARSRTSASGEAVHVLHDEVEIALRLDDVEDRHHVRVAHPGGEARLVEEHRPEGPVGGEPGEEALDRDDPGEAAGADDPAEVHGAHPAGGERLAEDVAPGEESGGRSCVFVGHRGVLRATSW